MRANWVLGSCELTGCASRADELGARVVRTNWVRDLLVALLDPALKPTWSDEPKHDPGELAALHGVLKVIEKKLPELQLPPIANMMITNVRTMLEKAIEDDEVTEEERENARKQVVALFQLAQALPR